VEPELQRFEIALRIGEHHFTVELHTTLGSEAAGRRAMFALASQHRDVDLDAITVLSITQIPLED
jgi:hypothetical protein